MDSVELAVAYLHLVPSLQGAEQTIASELGGVGDDAGKKAGIGFGAAFTAALGAAAIAGAVVAGFAGLYAAGNVFDDVSDTIRIRSGETGENLKALEAVAKNVATSVPTSFSAAGDTVAALNQRLDLSAETLTTVASQYIEAGRLLGQDVDINSSTAAFSAFHIEGDAVIGAMDTLFRVSQASGVGINELTSAAQQNAPAMQNLGFSYDETVSLIGTLDKAGINSTQTLAAMGKGLVSLAKDGEEPQAAFRRVTDEIKALIDSGDTAGAIDLASGVFGTKAANQFVGAVQSGTLALDDLVGGLNVSSDTILGVAAETADFGESWTIVKNNALAAIEPLATGVFNLLGGAMSHVADISQELGPKLADGFSAAGSVLGPIFERLGPIFEQLVPQLLDLWQAFSPLSLILQVLTPILPMLANVFGQLAATLGGALGTALQSVMGALAPVVQALTGSLSQILITLLPIIANIAIMLAGVLGDALVQLAPVVGQLAATLGGVLGNVLTALSPLLVLIATLIGSVLQAVLPLIGPVLDLVMAFLPLLAPIIELVGKLLTPLIELLTAILTPILALISPLIDLLAGALGFVIEILAKLIGWVVEGIVWFVNLVTGSEDASDQLNAVWGALGDFFGDVWRNILQFFADGISGVLGFVGDLQENILNAVKGAGNWLLDVGRNIVQGLIDGISGMAKRAVETITNLGTAMLDGVKDLLGIHSPSSVYADEVGEPIGDGIDLGLERTEDAIQARLNALVAVPDISKLAPVVGGGSLLGVAADLNLEADGVVDEREAQRRSSEPMELSEATIERLALAIARALRRLTQQGGVTNG